MAEGLGRERWAHTSVLCSMIANANRDPKKHRAFKPSDFDPFCQKARQDRRSRKVADTESLALLREALEARKGF